MTDPTETPSLFSEEQLPAKLPARPKKPAAGAAKKPTSKPRAKAPKKAAAQEPEPETPAPMPAAKAPAPLDDTPPVKKPATRSRAKKVPGEAPVAALESAPATVVEPPAVVAPPVQISPVVVPAPEVSVEPPAPDPVSRDSKKTPRRPAPQRSRGKSTPVKPPVVHQFRQPGEVEEWQPGSHSKRVVPAQPTPTPTPEVSSPSAPQLREPEPAAPAAVAPPVQSVTPLQQPLATPATPAQPDISQAGGQQSREERIAAAMRRFESGNVEQFAGRPPENLRPPGRPDFGSRDRQQTPGRHDRNDRHSRHQRHDRHDRRDRPERFDQPREPRAEYEAAIAPVPEEPIGEPVFTEGLLEVSGKGFGFLRDPKRGYAQHPSDIFVTPEVCRQHTLRDGMWVKGEVRRGNRGPQLYKLTAIEGEDPEKYRNIPMFDELTSVNPSKWIKLETTPERFTTRVVDLMSPIGKGQRGIIVAPPRTGKTTYLQHMAEAIGQNHPEMKLIVLLVDERPEEVTEMKRTLPFAEIMASSNDQDVKSHTRIAQLAIERARRLVEMGKDVFVLLDSITRVGRAFNNAQGGGGRTMSGGVDARALEIPRKLFAAARNTEEAGSLTIIATALIQTGSLADELIFQEFKGTGNMELVLDRKISDLRIYPAVDIFQSGTRRDELLLTEAELHKINLIRRGLAGHKPPEAIERLLFFLQKFPTNAQMLREIPG